MWRLGRKDIYVVMLSRMSLRNCWLACWGFESTRHRFSGSATADVLQFAEYPFLYLKAADFPSPVEAGHARCKMHQMDGTQFGG
jgi:hypothetical protein